MKRPRSPSPAGPSPVSPPRRSPRLLPMSSSDAFQAAPCPRPNVFFDAQPHDTLIHIIHLLSRHTAPFPSVCPILNLARVSPNLRRLIAHELGSRLAFSISAHPGWFWAWLSVAGKSLRHLSFHARPFPPAAPRHVCTPVATPPDTHLDAAVALRAVRAVRPPLVDLDISGLYKPSAHATPALAGLLRDVRATLLSLKLDLNFPGAASCVSGARLNRLHRLVVVNANSQSNGQLLPLLYGLRETDAPDAPICVRELTLDACDALTTALVGHLPHLRALLARLHTLHLDFDDDLAAFTKDTPAATDRLLALLALPNLHTLTLSGSGVPITRHLVTGLRTNCPALRELRLVDCDVEPATRRRRSGEDAANGGGGGVYVLEGGEYVQVFGDDSDDEEEEGGGSGDDVMLPAWAGAPDAEPRSSRDESRVARACRTLAAAGPLLTHYYPRWVNFDVRLLNALAAHCPKLTHLRVFTAPGAEAALSVLAERVADSLVDLDVYPKRHERKDEMAGKIVQFVTSLRALERVCLVTLDLSAAQLVTVLQHCGPRLRTFAFSPPLAAERVRDLSAKVMADVLIAAAKVAPRLERVDVIFPHDWPPTVETRAVMDRVHLAVRTLEAKCRNLDMVNVRALVRRMTPCGSDGEDMLSEGDESEEEEEDGGDGDGDGGDGGDDSDDSDDSDGDDGDDGGMSDGSEEL